MSDLGSSEFFSSEHFRRDAGDVCFRRSADAFCGLACVQSSLRHYLDQGPHSQHYLKVSC